MKARLFQVASSLAALALPLTFLTGCPGDSSWEKDAEVHELSKGALVTIQATDEPAVDGEDDFTGEYTLKAQPGASWPGKGSYFFPPGMHGDAEISEPCPGNQYDCKAPKDASVKVLEARTIETFSLRVTSDRVTLPEKNAPTEIEIVVSTNLIPMVDCSKPGTCFDGMESDITDNGDGTWSLGFNNYSYGSVEVIPRIVAYGMCANDEPCSAGPGDHLTIVRTKLWL